MLFGLDAAMLALFVGFGLLVGVLFGFFGMGGSFLVTPALLVLGYPSRVAVGSGLAFVFGTSVIATLKHRDLGQVDYKLGVAMIAGTTLGIEVGKEMVLELESVGLAGDVISVAYVVLLGGVGLFVTYDSLRETGDHDDPGIASYVQSIRLWPMLSIRGGIQVSLWLVLLVAFLTGLLSGFLGVGGGFIRMPALFYFLGVPVPVAVGTDLFEIVFSGGIGSVLYAQSGGVRLDIVAPLLAGSAFGAQVGSAATNLVDEEGIKVYFGLMLLLGALAVAVRQAGASVGVPAPNTVSFLIIVGAAVLVTGAILRRALTTLRTGTRAATTAD